MQQLLSWKKELLERLVGWTLEGGIALSPTGFLHEEGYWDIDYESILKDPYRTVSREHPFYVKAIEAALKRIRDVPQPVVADLGCGDGRFVRLFIEKGMERVVGLDISRMNLRRLEARIKETPGATEKVLLIEGDALAPTFLAALFDLVIVIGMPQVTDDQKYRRVLVAWAETLKSGGYLLTVDPTDFGAAMYAIVRHDLGELHQVVEQNTKTVDIEKRNASRIAVRGVEKIRSAHAAAGFEVEETVGIPIFPSLLFGGVKQMRNLQQEQLTLMKQLNDRLIAAYPDCWRAACVLSRKRA